MSIYSMSILWLVRQKNYTGSLLQKKQSALKSWTWTTCVVGHRQGKYYLYILHSFVWFPFTFIYFNLYIFINDLLLYIFLVKIILTKAIFSLHFLIFKFQVVIIISFHFSNADLKHGGELMWFPAEIAKVTIGSLVYVSPARQLQWQS